MTDAPSDETLSHWEGEPVRVWEGLWGIPALEVWPTLGSTNDRARTLGREGAPPYTVIVAEEQTAGRGRAGRAWNSPAGRGLWLSFVTVRRPPAQRALTPLLVGLALARAIEDVTGAEPGIKWPNDVWLGGRKVAGVLCETTDSCTVVGVGINVRQTRDEFPPELVDRATSLEREIARPVSRSALAGALLGHARALLDPTVLRLDGALAAELAGRDLLLDRPLRAGESEGVGRGVDSRGRLRVEGPDGSIRFVAAGHVEFGEARPAP